MLESKWIVDENYLKHITAEIKKLKETNPKDRLELQFWMLTCSGMIIQHVQSSLIGAINAQALGSGMLNNIDEAKFRELWEDYRKLALNMLKVDEKLTKMIPTATTESLKAAEQVEVKVHESNPLVA